MNLPISTPFLITFDAGDPGGIMFFPNFFVYTQRAWEHQLEAHGVSWKEWYDHPEWAVPLKHVEADYFKMVRAGTRVEIFQGVEALGDSSVTLAHEFRDSSGAVCARLKTVHVFLNKSTLKKISVPPMIRRYLESLLIR